MFDHEGTGRGPSLLAVATLLALILVAPACGARWTDEQRAQVLGSSARQVVAPQPSVTGGASEATAPGAPATLEAGAASVAAPVAGPGGEPAAAPVAPGAKPCASPATAPGVSDGEIRVGSISSLSGPVSGLGASSAAGTRAYVAYRNSQGGVCGRKIVLQDADDGTDNGRYRRLASEMADKVFGIVGGFALGDIGGADILEGKQVPVVNVPAAEQTSAVSTVFDINPRFENLDAAIGKYRYIHQQGARKVAMVYLAVEQSRTEANNHKRLMAAAGLEVVKVQELPISTLSYDSAARGAANSGADYLFFIGDGQGNASMARSVADADYRPKFAEYFTFAYGERFTELAGGAAEGATSWLRTLPNEEAGSNPEMATFLRWMDRIAPDVVRDVFAADAWASAKAFFDGLDALPGPIRREDLVARLRATETYDAGGMLGPIRLGAELTNACYVGMRVEGGVWKRMTPARGFLC